MPRFLIDVNLPYYFSIWDGDAFVYQRDIDDEWTDDQIWEYAKANQLTIISKDSDFSHRVILHDPPPKVIHVRIGNMRMKEFFTTLHSLWPATIAMLEEHKLVSIYPDRVEGVE